MLGGFLLGFCDYRGLLGYTQDVLGGGGRELGGDGWELKGCVPNGCFGLVPDPFAFIRLVRGKSVKKNAI